ncbi:MAG: hypothetical protein J6R22_03105 [Alphaproteobacteria bacterium]|nr:hypothetical protein [Alphaproteobacteria bacterium]
MAKKVKAEVFDILKSLADNKARKLEETVQRGQAAKEEAPLLERQIQSLQKYVENNAYDRESVRDAEHDIADYESQLAAVHNKKRAADKAREDLAHYPKFKETYVSAVRGDKIDELQRAINKLRNELAKIDGNMDTEMINMDNETLDEDVREQARQDYDTYVLQQENLIKTMEIYKEQLKKLKEY